MTPLKVSIGKERSIVIEPGQELKYPFPKGIDLVISDKDTDPDHWWVKAIDRDSEAVMQEFFVDDKSPSGEFYPSTGGDKVRTVYISKRK